MEDFGSDTPNIPNQRLSEKQFLLTTKIDSEQRDKIVQEIVEVIKTDNLGPYYEYLTTELPELFPLDSDLLEKLTAINEKELTILKLKVKEAEGEEETELDIVSTTIKLAEYYTTIIDRENSIEVYKKALELPQSTGSKIDILLTLTRIEFFFNDYQAVSKYLDQTKSLIDKGGDWERRNR